HAKDKATSKEQSIRITSSGGLSDAEIEKMKNAAKEHAAEDSKKKEAVETKNQADNLVFQTKKQLSELGDKVSPELKNKLEAEIKKVEDAIATNDTAKIKSATEELNKVWAEASQELYKNAGAPGADPSQGAQGDPTQGAQNAADGAKEEEVQDASYEEVVDEDDSNKK
ncbi:MAG: Hsp70 family protein, partial [Melioribacteraceae bacterium]|nr:Hsp70 family protein [Melioribacteraceae bacterium]